MQVRAKPDPSPVPGASSRSRWSLSANLRANDICLTFRRMFTSLLGGPEVSFSATVRLKRSAQKLERSPALGRGAKWQVSYFTLMCE